MKKFMIFGSEKVKKGRMEIKRLSVLALKFLKRVNKPNPNYINGIFTLNLHSKIRSNDILVKHHNKIDTMRSGRL